MIYLWFRLSWQCLFYPCGYWCCISWSRWVDLLIWRKNNHVILSCCLYVWLCCCLPSFESYLKTIHCSRCKKVVSTVLAFRCSFYGNSWKLFESFGFLIVSLAVAWYKIGCKLYILLVLYEFVVYILFLNIFAFALLVAL